MNNMMIDTSYVEEKISHLKKEKERLENIYRKFNDDILLFQDSCNGDTSEEAIKRLNNSKKESNSIIENIEKMISFLQSVNETYIKLDEYIDEKENELDKINNSRS